MTSINGLSSGLDTANIINQLMQIERRPQVALQQRQDQETAARTELSDIRSEISSLRNMAADLRLPTSWNRVTATSSNEEAVSVSASSAATTGSYSFTVTSVATAASVYSNEVWASLDDPTGAAGPSVFNASGYGAIGFSNLEGTGFADGTIDFEVTQSSAAGTVEGASIPTIPIDIDGTNDTIDVEVDGISFSITLAHGNYETEQDLADAFSDAVTGSAAAAFGVSLVNGNQISLSTKAEGSDHSVTVTGGTAVAALGLTANVGVAGTGVDGIVEVNGTATVITDVTAGTTATLPSGGAGSIEATLNGGLRVGTATVTQSTSSGSGSLTDLVASLNAADLGYTAYAVNTGNGYRLQLTANETGADSAFVPDPAIFGGTTFTVLSEGTDAELTLEGENPFTIVSSDNTFEEILPGVAVTVNDVTAGPVTVATERDVEAITTSVDELITKFNEILTRISTSTANDPDGERAVLQGNQSARKAADELRNAFVAAIDDNPFTSVGVVGLELTREGSLTFDKAKFEEAILSDPASLSELFANPSPLDEGAQLGALDRLVEAAETATTIGDGYLYTAGQSVERRIDDYGRQIEAFERRLELRESTLRRTYANLEVALGGLQQQSGWLSSQLGSLGGGSIL
jgi:flagellar hook-associated protein 2